MKEPSYIELTLKIDQEGKYFVSHCLEFGLASQGNSLDEALRNIKDAVHTLLNELDEFDELDGYLSEHGVTVHPGEPPNEAPPKKVDVERNGEIVSLMTALLGQPALSR